MPSSFLFAVVLLISGWGYLLIRRCLQKEIHQFFSKVTRDPRIAVTLLSFILFPGVAIHETSHWVAARLLGVHTGKVSILPHITSSGMVRLGLVETEASDFIREALIGAAPLFSGMLLTAYIGIFRMQFAYPSTLLLDGHFIEFMKAMANTTQQPDFWLWLYLALAISNTMFPSAADRKAWLPLLLVICGVLFLVVISGSGNWMLATLGQYIDHAVGILLLVNFTSLVVHLVILLPMWGINNLLDRAGVHRKA